MKTLRVLLVLLTAGLGGLISATAQTTPAAVQPVKFRFMSWEKSVTGLYVTDDDKQFTRINAPVYEWGDTFELKASSLLRLYRQTEKDGKKIYEPVVEAALDRDVREFQVALVRLAGENAYRMIVLSNDARHFPAGEIRLFNFSPHPAMIRLGGEDVKLAALEWRKLPVKPDRKYRVIMQAALQVNGDWVNGGNEIITLRPDYRGEIMIIHTAAGVGAIESITPGAPGRPLTIAETEYVAPPPARNIP